MIAKPGEQFRVEAGGPLTDEQRVATDWAAEAVRTRLPLLRTVAQHWQTTISTITGLFGAATLLGADKEVRSLAPGWDYLYGLLAVLSLICAALALKLASQAGEPDRLTIPAAIDRQVELYNQVFETVSRRLWWSRLWTAPAVALLIFAIGVRWYAPQILSGTVDDTRALSQERGYQQR